MWRPSPRLSWPMFLKDSILFCGVSGKLPARPQLSTVVCFFLLSIFFHRQMKRRGEEGWEPDKAKKNNTDTNANSKLDRKGACRAGRGRHEFSLPNTNNKLKQGEKGSIEVGVWEWGSACKWKRKQKNQQKQIIGPNSRNQENAKKDPAKRGSPCIWEHFFVSDQCLDPCLPSLPCALPSVSVR